MAIRIEAQLAKKLPIPGADFSSQQAAITISAEVGDPARVVDEAARLYRLCERAVDAQLGIARAALEPTGPRQMHDQGPGHTTRAASSQSRAADGFQRPSSPGRSSQRAAPARSYPSSRRGGPPPISAAQRRLLDRLLGDIPDRGRSWLDQRGVDDLAGIDMAEASALIDELKGAQA